MNLPDDNREDKFCPLAKEFNASAKRFAEGNGLSLDGLMTKFDVLWRFKAENPEDKLRLTQGMFDGGMDILRKIANPNFHETLGSHANNINHIFTFLTTSEQLQYLPVDASDQLVDAALNLIRKSEGVTHVYGWNDYVQHKNELINISKTVAGFAEKTRAPKPAGAVFAIEKTIPPAKRLTVCAQGNGG